MKANLLDLAAQVEKLPPWQKLYIASELLRRDDGKDHLAITIAENVILEYHAARLFAERKAR